MTSVSHPDQSSLLESLRKGDHAAFAQIYELYWKKMLLVAWNHTGDESLSEDIVHEVFLKLWDNRNNYHITNISGFLATAVKFAVFNNYRKQKNRQNLAEAAFVSNLFQDDEKELDILFLEEYIAGIVEKMPEKCKIVFKHSRHEGLKNSEIAELLNISEKGVEANLTRAIKILKERMRRDGLYAIVSAYVIDSIV